MSGILLLFEREDALSSAYGLVNSDFASCPRGPGFDSRECRRLKKKKKKKKNGRAHSQSIIYILRAFSESGIPFVRYILSFLY